MVSHKLDAVGVDILKTKVAGIESPGPEFDDFQCFKKNGRTLTDYKISQVNVSEGMGHTFYGHIGHIQSRHVKLEDASDEEGYKQAQGMIRFWTTTTLGASEYITRVSGTWGYIISQTPKSCINKLIFHTSTGRALRHGSMGVRGGVKFDFVAPPDHCVVGFWGKVAKSNLTLLGVYVARMLPLDWTEDNHHRFPPSFKEQVKSFLMVCKRHEEEKWEITGEPQHMRIPFLGGLQESVRHQLIKCLARITFSSNNEM